MTFPEYNTIMVLPEGVLEKMRTECQKETEQDAYASGGVIIRGLTHERNDENEKAAGERRDRPPASCARRADGGHAGHGRGGLRGPGLRNGVGAAAPAGRDPSGACDEGGLQRALYGDPGRGAALFRGKCGARGQYHALSPGRRPGAGPHGSVPRGDPGRGHAARLARGGDEPLRRGLCLRKMGGEAHPQPGRRAAGGRAHGHHDLRRRRVQLPDRGLRHAADHR